MIRKKFSAILIILIIFSLAACSGNEKKRYEAQFMFLFDTTSQIIGYSESKEKFSDHVQLIHDELEEYNKLFDIYNDYEGINNIKTINDNAGIAPVKVDQRIIELLDFSKDAYSKTDGKVNVAFGAVLKIWHDYRTVGTEDAEKAELPPVEYLIEANNHTDINDVIIDREASTVFLRDPEMSLDVGAIAKGYSVEQVSKTAVEHGFDSGLISVGGNVRTIGYKGDDKGLWNVGIQNPDRGQPDLYYVSLTDKSLVTSGNYIRYYTVDGKKYHHIINPETLFPTEYYDAVTIICRDSGVADALSTAVFNMPFEQGKELIESLPETEAVWIFPDGKTEYSSHFEDILN